MPQPSQPRHVTPSAMVPKPERSSDTPARDRVATATDQPEARETISNSAFTRAPSYSPTELASFRDFAKVMRDAIGEKGSFNELKPGEAAQRGCLDTLKILHRRGRVAFNVDLCTAAAYGGQLEVLKWLRENSYPWDEMTCACAASGGYLKMLQWARANGCPWDERTFLGGAYGGHLKVLQWARANGCPWDAETCAHAAADGGITLLYSAARDGHEAVVRALVEAGADFNKAKNDRTTPLFVAAVNCHEAVVRVLIEAGVDVNKALSDGTSPLIMAVHNGFEAVVQALIEAGADVNKAEARGVTPLYIAAQNGFEAVLRALIEAGADINQVAVNGSTPLSVSMMLARNAAQGNHAAIYRSIVQILRDAGAA